MPKASDTRDVASTTQLRSEPHFSLANDENDIGHLVCCRDPKWDVALCGEANDRINVNVQMVCTMCIEIAKGFPGWDPQAEPPVCIHDGEPCPDEHEIDLRILGEVTP